MDSLKLPMDKPEPTKVIGDSRSNSTLGEHDRSGSEEEPVNLVQELDASRRLVAAERGGGDARPAAHHDGCQCEGIPSERAASSWSARPASDADREGSDSGLGSDSLGAAAYLVSPVDNFDDPEDNKFLSQLVSISDSQCRHLRVNAKRTLVANGDEPATKRNKKCVRFEGVTVYYFERAQGFACVPSQGGSTLGMARHHTHATAFTLQEHASEQRRAHRARLQQLRAERLSRAQRPGAAHSDSDTHSDSDSDASSGPDSDCDLDAYCFPQPLPARRRRALLRAAGVRRIDPAEREACRELRAARELCGCACGAACAPDTCACAAAGISCQVDRLGFPCACARAHCANPSGRLEFDPLRVQTHLVRTLLRLGLQRRAPYASYPYAADGHAHTYPESSFEEFARPTHMSMFTEYGHDYAADGSAAVPGASAPEPPSQPSPLPPPPDTTGTPQQVPQCESSQTFGDIIKNAIVESVIG